MGALTTAEAIQHLRLHVKSTMGERGIIIIHADGNYQEHPAPFWQTEQDEGPRPQENETIITEHLGEPVHLTTSLNAKGKVQFEISVHTMDTTEAEKINEELDAWVRTKYAGKLAGEGEQ